MLDVIVGGDFQVEPALTQNWNVLRCQAWCSRLQIEAKPHATPSVGAAVDQICCTEGSIHATAQACLCHLQATPSSRNLSWMPRKNCRSNPLLDKPLLDAWNAGKLVWAAVQSARCDPSWNNADQALAEAYSASANLWEAEIRRITGAHHDSQRLAPCDFHQDGVETSTQENKARTGSIVCDTQVYGMGALPPGRKKTKRELAASCVTTRSMEWALSRLVEARHWAQCAVRRGASTSSVTKFSTAISSFRQVTEDFQSEDLIKLREGGLLLLDKLKQITLAWVSFWKNVVSGQGEEEQLPTDGGSPVGGSWDATLSRIGRMGSHRS